MITTVREGYRVWSASYDRSPNPVIALEARTVAPLLSGLAGKRVLDAACGTGRWLEFAQAVGARAAGIDLSREMLLQAAAKNGLSGRLAEADLRILPLATGSVDVAICSLSLGYVPSAEDAMRELARVTAAGGMIIASDLHPAALRSGWKRSFCTNGRTYEIQHYCYSVPALLAAAKRLGLRLLDLKEPHFGEPERAIFDSAGVLHRFAEASSVRAIWVARWQRC
ncbi:MAG TPA: class I SAM-dependent methyltransferase [Bryobacteraceae bacterium]|nr:class I SAM-dependent methyltransferase [Bryobacteraceae bacterium]